MGTPLSDQNGTPNNEPAYTGDKKQPLVAHEHDHEIEAEEDEGGTSDETPEEEQGRATRLLDRAPHGKP